MRASAKGSHHASVCSHGGMVLMGFPLFMEEASFCLVTIVVIIHHCMPDTTYWNKCIFACMPIYTDYVSLDSNNYTTNCRKLVMPYR